MKFKELTFKENIIEIQLKTNKVCLYCETGSSEIRCKIANTRDIDLTYFLTGFTQEEIFGGKFLI